MPIVPDFLRRQDTLNLPFSQQRQTAQQVRANRANQSAPEYRRQSNPYTITPVVTSNQPAGYSRADQGQVLGATTTATQPAQTSAIAQTTPVGGGSTTDFQSIVDRAPMISQPERPSEQEVANVFNPLIGSLAGEGERLEGLTNEQIVGLQSNLQAQRNRLQNELQNRIGGINQQRAQRQGETESAIAEARRQAAEMQRGIAARFGGATGTGRFASELMGREAIQNIAANRQNLQNVMGQLDVAEEQTKNEFADMVNQAELQTQNLIDQARRELSNALQRINERRGELESAKAQARMEQLENFRDRVDRINAANTAFKQDIFGNVQNRLAKLEDARARVGRGSISQVENIPVEIQTALGETEILIPVAPGQTQLDAISGLLYSPETEELRQQGLVLDPVAQAQAQTQPQTQTGGLTPGSMNELLYGGLSPTPGAGTQTQTQP